MGDLFVAHVEVLLQYSVDLPPLNLDSVIVLKLPAHLVGAANVVTAQDHLFDHLLDGCSSITFSYVLQSHLFQHVSVGLHSPDELAHTCRGDPVLPGNGVLLVSTHDRLVCDVQDVAVGQLWPVLDPLSKLGWRVIHPVGRVNISVPQPRVLVPALESFGQPVNLL